MPTANPLLLLSILWLTLVTWLIARAWRQSGVLARVVPLGDLPGSLPTLAVIVPARDEGANIGACVRSLLAQRYPAERVRIFVIDDGSQDDTAEIVAALARTDTRLTLLTAPPLPRGWKGKVHACWCAAQAVPADTPWLCFMDADMRADPEALAAAVQAAQARRLDLLSLAPRHELGSLAERLIIPCGLYLLGFSQDLERIQAPNSGEVVCTGQFMLMRRSAYDQVGGYASVRGSICEDVDFARLFKRSGFSVLLEDGSSVLVTRMYTGWRTLWPGIAKNLVEMLGGAPRALITALIAVTLAWTAVSLPLIEGFACAHGEPGTCTGLVLALLGSGAAFGLHVAGAAHFAIPWWYGLLFPIGYTTGALIALDSIRWRMIRRIEWKGRTYP